MKYSRKDLLPFHFFIWIASNPTDGIPGSWKKAAGFFKKTGFGFEAMLASHNYDFDLFHHDVHFIFFHAKKKFLIRLMQEKGGVMKKNWFFMWIIFLFSIHVILAQERRGLGEFPALPPNQSAILGMVVDEATGRPLGYANVVVIQMPDSVPLTGTSTNERGIFVLTGLKPGDYQLVVDFIGYKAKTIPQVKIQSTADRIRLGKITLQQAILEGQTIEVVAERPDITYQIDKKVIDVSKQLTSVNGTAIDVLENIPSVNVDIEGNVSLRGSGNFQVLIDGVPSILDPNDALRQIPASSIEQIEIITNPSVKYDPEGTSGIINIILKKSRKTGTSGMLNMNGGVNEKYGGDGILSIQSHKWVLDFGINYNNQKYPGDMRTTFLSADPGSELGIYSEGSSYRLRNFWNIRTGFSYKFSPREILQLSVSLGDRAFDNGSRLNYREVDFLNNTEISYSNRSEGERGGKGVSAQINYQKKFANKDKEFNARFSYDTNDGNEQSSNQLFDSSGLLQEGRINHENGDVRRIRLESTYSTPIHPLAKLESGVNIQWIDNDDISFLEEYDPNSGSYQINPAFNKDVTFQRSIYAAFSQLSYQLSRFEFMGGIRTEYTDREIRVKQLPDHYRLQRWDFFPSFHISLKNSKNIQWMGSYTRRINRPRGWFLEPFETWDDAYNVRRGNPALKPEYIHSFEAGIQFPWGKNLISLESYYRITENRIERIQQSYAPGITMHTFGNVGKDYALGVEFMTSLDLFPWYNIRLMGNVYDYRIEGTLFGQPFERNSFNWDARWNHTIAFSKRTQLQLMLMYNSPSVSSQGERKEFFTMNLGLKQDILPNSLILTLQVRDLLATSKFDFISTGPGFERTNYFTMDAPIVMVNLRYLINNFRDNRNRGMDNNGNEEDNGFIGGE